MTEIFISDWNKSQKNDFVFPVINRLKKVPSDLNNLESSKGRSACVCSPKSRRQQWGSVLHLWNAATRSLSSCLTNNRNKKSWWESLEFFLTTELFFQSSDLWNSQNQNQDPELRRAETQTLMRSADAAPTDQSPSTIHYRDVTTWRTDEENSLKQLWM